MARRGESGKSGGAEHTSNARGSTSDKHAKGVARQKSDQGGQKAVTSGRRAINPNKRRGQER